MVREKIRPFLERPVDPPPVECTIRLAVDPENLEEMRAATAAFVKDIGSLVVGNAEAVVIDMHIPEDPNGLGLGPYKKYQDLLADMSKKQIESHDWKPQEQEVAGYLVQGLNSTEIGEKLGIKPQQAYRYINSLRKKTGSTDRPELVAYLIGMKTSDTDRVGAKTSETYKRRGPIERPVLSAEQRLAIDTLTAQRIQYYNLSERQCEVASFILEGMSNREIAEELGVAELTVKGYVGALFARMNCANRIGVVRRLLGAD